MDFRKEIEDILKKDAEFRLKTNYATEDDLIDVTTIEKKTIPSDLTDIVILQYNEKNKYYYGCEMIEKETGDFQTRFYKAYPELKGIFNCNNVLVAGGIISSLVSNEKTNWNKALMDVDIFLYGELTTQQATALVNSLISKIYTNIKLVHINHWIEKYHTKDKTNLTKEELQKYCDHLFNNQSKIIHNLQPEFLVYKTKNVVGCRYSKTDNQYGERQIQFILRLYKSKSEILHGFDLGSSAFGFDGNNFWTTTLGKFALQYGANILDNSRRSTTYEKRIIKYLKRDYKLLMLNFDFEKLMTQHPDICEINDDLKFYYKIHKNTITYNKPDYYINNETDYDDDLKNLELLDLVFYPSVDQYLVPREIYKLNKFNDYNNLLKFEIFDENNEYKNIEDWQTLLTPEKIKKTYNNKKRRIYRDGLININLLQKYITIEDYKEVITNLIINPVKDINAYIDNLIAKQIEITTAKFNEQNKNSMKINWLIENPGTQLTSSFNPIYEEPEKWYGKYYKE